MSEARDVMANAILHYRGDGPQQDDEKQMAWTIFEALAVAGLVIVDKDDALWLRALTAAGVDNWQGIDHAIDLRAEMIAAEGGNDD